MAKVKAAYNYSYNYEGQKISFKKDEEFQLLTKSNNDWWQVRRWLDGCAQDIYVPAVYVKEVESSEPATQAQPDPTYANLNDFQKPKPRVTQNGTKPIGEKGPEGAPIVLNRPKSKKGASDRTNAAPTHVPVKRTLSTEKDSLESSTTVTSNGLSPARPVSPGMLRRLNKPSTMPAAVTVAPPSSSSGGSSQAASLGRGESLAPPPVSTKPRSKSNAEPPVPESSLDSGVRRQPGVVSGSGAKVRVPPPTKQRPHKIVPGGRPVSCVGDMESPAKPGFLEGNESAKPIVSELSSVLLRKNPHLASEHKPLAKTQSSGTVEGSTGSRGSGGVVSGEGLSKSQDAKTLQAKSPTEGPKILQDELPAPPTSPPGLPAGWTEHKTSSGQTYYYNSATGQSSWTRPQGDSENKILEKVAPRGWTKEINPITRTPVYTNSRNGERWALGSDAKGNYYYYNMINSSLTVGELPEVLHEENVYDSLIPKAHKGPSTPTSSPAHVPGRSQSTPNVLIHETIASSLSDVLKRHGILHRKRVYDSHGKKAKDRSWQKLYVCLQTYELLFYTDLRSKEAGQKPLSIFCLLQTTVSPYNKDKKKNVFQVSSHLGEQFLLQAETSNLMNEWYSTIQTAIDQANHLYKESPEKFRSCLQEPLDDGEGSPKIKRGGGFKASVRGASRGQSLTDEFLLEDEDEIVDDMEISAAERSGHIRGRLRRLMARRPEKDTLKSKGILEDPVFGCELATLCEREGTQVPKFFTQFTQHIEKVGLDVVGIYRLSGNAASINKLRYLVEQDQAIDLDSQEWSDVNIVTGCLKLYLRELPDPLIPFRLYKPFIEAARAPSQPQRIQQIAAKIKDLPVANYQTLKALAQHLRKVIAMGSVNKMLATNVAIVFGPTVMRAETDSLEMATLMPIQNGIMEIILNEYETIFRK